MGINFIIIINFVSSQKMCYGKSNKKCKILCDSIFTERQDCKAEERLND